ncbi:MAG TPA: M56 family metallopeptidase [Jatrophihabitans sp.]|nr:M56 family metallopeptidase [Jatrophihabitans sp.]
MTVGAALLLYAVVLGGLGPLVLRPGGWLSRAPRLGATMLLAASWSVLTALFLAGLTIALPGTALSSGLSDLLGACILRLRAAYATPGGAAVAGAGLTLSATIAIRAAWALVRGVRVRRRERFRQRTLIKMCGEQPSAAHPVILDQPQPAAYCLGGRDRTVVVTRGAVDLLTAPQLAAVLAHEHAHLGARHHRTLAVAALARSVLPELPLVRDLPHGVHCLLEMHADDVAARSHDPETLATALVAVASATAPAGSLPSAALAAADTEAIARIRRLLVPPRSLTGLGRRSLRAAVAAFALVPVLLALTPAAVAANQPPVRQAQVTVHAQARR